MLSLDASSLGLAVPRFMDVPMAKEVTTRFSCYPKHFCFAFLYFSLFYHSKYGKADPPLVYFSEGANF